MDIFYHPDDRRCGLCTKWQQTKGEYQLTKRKCCEPQSGWFMHPREYSDGSGCFFFKEVE